MSSTWGSPCWHPRSPAGWSDDYVSRPLRGDHSEALAALTERELEVFQLIGRERTNSDIAAELYVSEATVKTHVNRLFAKLGVRGRAHAVIAAYEHALVERGRPPA